MDKTLMSMILDERLVVTAVTLSRKEKITTSEAYRAMTEFYKKHTNHGGIWATVIVSGYREKFGVSVRSTIVCREEQLETVKKQFLNVDSVELFSLQAVPLKDISSILARDRLEDLKSFHIDTKENAPNPVKYCAEDFEVLRSDQHEVFNAMKRMADGGKPVSCALPGSSQ
ncbi:unnamed protein product [Cylicocyclus nassatus]|uniref:DNA polymerase delta subunit 3 n=1 Tax=Cylicocyclus nassatus TaxID=53992 RepID=A0AA36HFY3_CYLNA|nr:unnamed protein product [Cylicocyclus nassatus]